MILLYLLMIALAILIGYLAQVTGLCLVRGVPDWKRAKRVRLAAILTSGFWIYLFLPLIPFFHGQGKLVGMEYIGAFLPVVLFSVWVQASTKLAPFPRRRV